MRQVPVSISLLALFLLVLVGGVMLSGCADSIVSDCEIPAGALPISSRFSDIEQKVFAVNCATAGCHTGTNPEAGLDLSVGKAYDQLVNVASLNYPTQLRVAPGSSTQSILIGALRRSIQPAMPPNESLASGVVDSIATWIDRGAPRD